MKYLIAIAALAVATPAHAQITAEKADEYIEVCKHAYKVNLVGKPMITYVKSKWPTLDEALENMMVCVAYVVGRKDQSEEFMAHMDRTASNK